MESFKGKNWYKIPETNALFILNEGKEYLKGLDERSKRITDRALTIINFLVPIILALIGISFNASHKSNIPWFIFWGLITVTLCLIVAVFLLGRIISPRLYHLSGRQPIEISNDFNVGLDENAEYSKISLIISEIIDIQDKIDYNSKSNRLRAKTLDKCIRIVAVTLLAAIILLVIFHLSNL